MKIYSSNFRNINLHLFYFPFELIIIQKEMSGNCAIRVTVCSNTNHQNKRPLVIKQLELKSILKQCSNKLKMKAAKLYTKNGEEINNDNINEIV